MGFFNTLLRIGGGVLNTAMEQHDRTLKKAERKLDRLDSKSDSMNSEQREKIKKAREKLNKAPKNSNNRIKTLRDWDREWINIGNLQNANLTPYNKSIGVYRHVINGETMYIGRAIEINNGGFRKRLSDYTRASDSARKHGSGQTIHENSDRITTYILVVGSLDDPIDDQESIRTTKLLEKRLIAKYKPVWNVQHN